MKSVSLLLLLMLSTLSGGCSSDSVTGSTPSGQTLNTTTTSTTVAAIDLTATPTTVSALGTVAIAAVLTDSTGANVSDGTAVSFSVTSNSALGSVSPTATAVSGLATGTFTANSTAGTVVVTVSADGVSATISIPILGVDVGSIQFTSATPNVIGLKGSGQTETSVLSFAVKDVNGQNAPNGISVTFSLSGPGGGELITPTTGSTSNGVVTTTLQSGTVAGPVRVTAATVVNTVSISSISTAVSIGGGVPSLSHFTLAASVFNLAGLHSVNLNSTLSVFLADRFGNFNVLEGTSVSFLTESGAIDASNVTDSSGVTTALFRTQSPIPLIYSTANPDAGETPPTNGDPVNGQSMVLAMTRGEECFVDNNGNGIFDGEPTDTFPVTKCDLGEPHVDFDDDGTLDTTDDIFIDVNGNGQLDGGNGVWDGDTLLWRATKLLITNAPSQVVLNPPSGFLIADGTTVIFTVCIADENSNAPTGGSTLAITASQGTITSGGGTITLPDSSFGRYCRSFAIEDAQPADTDPTASMTIEIKTTFTLPGGGSLIRDDIFTGSIE